MKKYKFLRIMGIVLGSVVILILGVIFYITSFLPHIKLRDIRVEISRERIERGKYLANHVSVCIDCHSTRDWSKFSGPLVSGTEGKGGEEFNRQMGLPGVYYSKNITPFGLNSWTDAELYRAITSGVPKNGKPLFPLMPYRHYGQMDTGDIYSIIAYIRSLPAVANQVPSSVTDFPVNIFLHLMPEDAHPGKIPPKTDQVNYGKYLVNAAGCFDCHTNYIKGDYVKGQDFAGGREFAMPKGTVRTANITPDLETGIGAWNMETFVVKFKSYDLNQVPVPELKISTFQTIMPWTMYSGMETEDIRAIYSYLRTVKPVSNKVDRWEPR